MKQRVGIVGAVVVAALTVGMAAADPISGPGRVIVGADASVWDSSIPAGDGILPIGGSGQINGEFTIARRLGIEIGLRAQDRFDGPLPAYPNKNAKVGIYEVESGIESGAATWNFDWHIDLRKARGKAKGKTIGDFDVRLETDMFGSFFGFPVPVDLTFGGFVPGNVVLYQSSQNPTFGNLEFDPSATGTYAIRLVLTPKTFKGAPLAVTIRVNAG